MALSCDWQRHLDNLMPPESVCVRTCNDCKNDIFEGENNYYIDGDWWCEECIDSFIHHNDICPPEDVVNRCDVCDKFISTKDKAYIINGDVWCCDCLMKRQEQAELYDDRY